MRFVTLAAMVAATIAVATVAAPVDAKSRHPAVAKRPATRITVTRRSYLDAGTEVLPGDRKFTEYVFPLGFLQYNPNYSNPTDPVGARFTPLSDPFWPRW
jgi:hypothetical protein